MNAITGLVVASVLLGVGLVVVFRLAFGSAFAAHKRWGIRGSIGWILVWILFFWAGMSAAIHGLRVNPGPGRGLTHDIAGHLAAVEMVAGMSMAIAALAVCAWGVGVTPWRIALNTKRSERDSGIKAVPNASILSTVKRTRGI